jgi:chromosome segregation ATPase
LEAELERETQAVQEEKIGLSSDLEQHRDDLIKCHDAISELQIQIKQLTSENDGLLDEKLQLEDQVSAHKSLLDAQRTKLAQHTRLSDSFKKQQKDGNQQLQRLELENQR